MNRRFYLPAQTPLPAYKLPSTLLVADGVTVAFYVSRRRTHFTDVPSGGSQMIIKLSLGNAKKETFYGQFGFLARDGLSAS